MKTKLLKYLGAATTLAGIMVTTGTANAASLTRTASTNLIDFADIDIINSPLSIEKFDPSLGKLNSVQLDFTSDLTGKAGFENRSRVASTVTVKLGAEIDLKQDSLDLSSLFPVTPVSEQSYSLSAYDGKLDFGGTSGNTVAGLTATQTTSTIFTDVSNLALFTGTGNLEFLYSALANSSVSGSGNITSFVDTLAKASLSITYNYSDSDSVGLKTVPEPSAALGIGLFAGIGLLSQRKKAWLKISNS